MYDEEEDLTLTAPEDLEVSDVAVRPSNLLEEQLNLDIVAPRANVPPPVAANKPTDDTLELYPLEDRRANIQRIRDAQREVVSQGSTTDRAPSLLNKAPAWYQGGKPPGGNDWAKALIGMGTGMISGPAAVSMQNPLRSLANKQRDAKTAALGQGLEALLGGLVSKDKTEYDRNQQAAQREATMTQVLPGKTVKTDAQKRLDSATDYEKLAQHQAGLDSLEKNRQFQQERERALHDQNNPELQAAKNTLVAKGMATPEELAGHTLASLQKQYGLINTAETEAGKSARQEAGALNKREEIKAQKNAQSEIDAQKRRNEDASREAQAFIDQDIVWRGGAPPDEPTQREVRKQVTARNYSFDALDRMGQIQQELNKMNRGFSGTLSEWLGSLEGTPNGQRAQELVLEAQQIQNNLKIQERIRANMGVPQAWENALVSSLIPQAGNFQGWLKGGASWKALKDQLDKYTYGSIKANGAGLKSKGDAGGAAPQYETSQLPVAPVAKVRGKQVVQDEPLPEVPVVSERLPVVPMRGMPTPAQPQTSGKRIYTITDKQTGASFQRELTEAEAEAKRAAGKGRWEIQ